MLITEILNDLNRDALIDLFGAPAVTAVESNLSEKAGKFYVQCLARNKKIQAKREELVRQLWLHRLVLHYQYPVARLTVEYPITFGRDSSKRADIVVFDSDRPTVPYLVVEVKQGKLKDGKEQLRSYTHATGAPLAMWCNGVQAVTWHRKNPNYFVEIPDIPSAAQTIDDIAGQPWTVDNLIAIEKKREAEGKGARSLKQLIEDMENEVLANAGVDVFEEVFKLIFTKLYDEMYCFRGRHKYLRFRNSNTAAQLKANIQGLFDDARQQWPGVFSEDEKLKLGPEHLQVCVGSLEEWKLFNSNLDVVDEAFEYLVSKSSKGEKGQYFTPRWVIDLCVKMLNPHEAETVIDTACGSAGFTVHAIFHVWKQILQDEGLPVSHLFTMEAKPQRCRDYVQDKVFAIDFDEKSVRVARCLNLIAGDGQTNVLHLNTLDWLKWEERIQQDEDWRDTYGEGWKKFKKLRAVKNDNRTFRFDVLMANPPFAGDIKQSDMLSPYELGHKTNGKLESKIGRDLVIEESLPANIDQDVARITWPDKQHLLPEFVVAYLNSTFGQDRITRYASGMVQHGLSLEKVREIPLPLLSPETQAAIAETVRAALRMRRQAVKNIHESEQTLLRALGLENWQPPEPLTYTRSSCDVFAAGRLDAEHFQPKFDAMLNAIYATGFEVVELANAILPIKNGFDSRLFVEDGTPYIRVGDIGQCRIKIESAARIPISTSEVSKDISLEVDDVLFTRKGSYGNAAPVRSGDEYVVISSEIMLIRRKKQWIEKLLPEYLAMFFNSLAGRYQAEKWAHGVAFYSISQDDLNSFLIPIIPIEAQRQIKQFIDVAEISRRRAAQLLNAAQRAVEIAIETDEVAALAFLNAIDERNSPSP
ncbi:MAG TPA: hypothetical protein DEP36_10275 [Gammaproteobacteria bacterium]|nr:hypothetical protein [Gammaproteobacteria bacterium]